MSILLFLGIRNWGTHKNREISVNIKPIRNDADLTNSFIRLESIFTDDQGTLEADEMEV